MRRRTWVRQVGSSSFSGVMWLKITARCWVVRGRAAVCAGFCAVGVLIAAGCSGSGAAQSAGATSSDSGGGKAPSAALPAGAASHTASTAGTAQEQAVRAQELPQDDEGGAVGE